MLIASPFSADLAARVAAVDQRVELLYEPDLLPEPRYEGDHRGAPRALDGAEQARWAGLVGQAEVMLDFDALDPATLPQRAPQLRWVQATSAGIGELVERSGLRRSSIRFTTAAGVHATALAEFVVLGLLFVTRDVPSLQARQRARHWERFTARSLAGQRALVVGLGEIGREVARVLDALGVEVWGLRRTAGQAPPAAVQRLLDRGELRSALPGVDALVLACPLTDETRGLIGREELAALPASAALVNVARGPVVDEAALVDALQAGRLRGAALDVFEREPLPTDSPLWSLDNVLVSPHSASTVSGENDRIVDIFVDNLQRYLAGRPLRNQYEPERGY